MLQVIRRAGLTLSLPNTATVEVQQNFQIDLLKCWKTKYYWCESSAQEISLEW